MNTDEVGHQHHMRIHKYLTLLRLLFFLLSFLFKTLDCICLFKLVTAISERVKNLFGIINEFLYAQKLELQEGWRRQRRFISSDVWSLFSSLKSAS